MKEKREAHATNDLAETCGTRIYSTLAEPFSPRSRLTPSLSICGFHAVVPILFCSAASSVVCSYYKKVSL